MLNTIRATGGMAVAPHALAAQAGRDILREGGNAIEACIAMAASLGVLYPHMTGIGGDSFWLIHTPGQDVVAIDASGRMALSIGADHYRAAGLTAIPVRGPLAANTVAGTISGWAAAYDISRERCDGAMPLARLLADAIDHAKHGYVVTSSQARATMQHLDALHRQPGFASSFLCDGRPPAASRVMHQYTLAATLRQLAEAGLRDFYRGDLAASIAVDLDAVGSPLTHSDLLEHKALVTRPLSLPLGGCTLYNTPPPTQGLASLMILGLFERRCADIAGADSADYVHLVVEATKLAFKLRDRHVRDPQDMNITSTELLEASRLDTLAVSIAMEQAAPWTGPGDMGDTTWFGAVDAAGCAVSVIQSLYHEFGSGVVLPHSGICWQNRGTSFSLDAHSPRLLRPGRKPFHTLNPALARFDDGRVMVYGTMGGDGQPQTQAALFTRYARYGYELQAAVTAPRWLLGRTWGSNTNTLKLESRFDDRVVDELRRRSHTVEVVAPFDEIMGHAGALVYRPDGVLEGAADPRSDGGVAAL